MGTLVDSITQNHPRHTNGSAAAVAVADQTAPDPRPEHESAANARTTAVHAWMLSVPMDFIALASPALLAPRHSRALIAMAVLCVALLHSGGRYRARLHLSVLDELPAVVGRVLVAAAAVACVAALRHPNVSLTDFLRWAALSGGLLLVGRCLTNIVVRTARRRRVVQHPTVLLGFGPVGRELARLLGSYPQYGLRVVGYLDDRRSEERTDEPAPPRLGTIDRAEQIVRDVGADVVLVADPATDEDSMLAMLRTPGSSRYDLLVVPRLRDLQTQSGLGDHVGAIPIMRISEPSLTGLSYVLKRAFDVLVASLCLLAAAPIMIAIALLVRIADGPGVIFRQARMTRDGRIFEVLKFRSMKPIDDAESRQRWSVADDDRIGAVGRFLRRTSLDELPQLWNIVRGDMTLVGPRPERPHFVELFSAQHPKYARRHRVVCGLTGLAQVSGLRGDTSIEDRARYDNYYIENWSLWLDIKVLLRTISEVLGARGR